MNAPKVNPQRIKHLMESATIEVATIFDKVTLVAMKLENGFVLTASSGAVSPENYDEKIGTEICLESIKNQLWKLEGYMLQSRLAEETQPHPRTGHSFSYALEAMKNGCRVARAGWNGKGMWICKGEGSPAVQAERLWNRHTRAFAEQNDGTVEVLPYLIMKTADSKILMGWLASQSDMLAEDWEIID